MIEERIAKRYAKSMYDLAAERKETDAVLNDCQMMQNAFDDSRELVLFLKNPILSSERKIGLFRKIFGGKVTKQMETLIESLARRHRGLLLPWIVKEFIASFNKSHNQTPVEIVSAIDLDPNLIQKIVEKIETQLRTKALVKQTVDTSLIGGLRILMDDKLYDGSIATALRKIEKQFK